MRDICRQENRADSQFSVSEVPCADKKQKPKSIGDSDFSSLANHLKSRKSSGNVSGFFFKKLYIADLITEGVRKDETFVEMAQPCEVSKQEVYVYVKDFTI